MRFHSQRARVVIEIVSATEQIITYEHIVPPRGWQPMSQNIRQKFRVFKAKWTVELSVEFEGYTEVQEFDVNTKMPFSDMPGVIKPILDDLLNGETQVYGARVVATIK